MSQNIILFDISIDNKYFVAKGMFLLNYFFSTNKLSGPKRDLNGSLI